MKSVTLQMLEMRRCSLNKSQSRTVWKKNKFSGLRSSRKVRNRAVSYAFWKPLIYQQYAWTAQSQELNSRALVLPVGSLLQALKLNACSSQTGTQTVSNVRSKGALTPCGFLPKAQTLQAVRVTS